MVASSPNAAAPPTLKSSAVAIAGLMKAASSRLIAPSAWADWISRLGHGLRDQPRVRRLEERLRGAVEQADDDHVPDLYDAEGDQQREGPVQEASGAVGDDHDQLARQPVGDDAADQEQEDQRQRRTP